MGRSWPTSSSKRWPGSGAGGGPEPHLAGFPPPYPHQRCTQGDGKCRGGPHHVPVRCHGSFLHLVQCFLDFAAEGEKFRKKINS